jgi:hypothetical protein
MPYPALPDRRMAYHADGTRVYEGPTSSTASIVESPANVNAWNSLSNDHYSGRYDNGYVWLFFPESRVVSAIFTACVATDSGAHGNQVISVEGSNDSTNGLDGTWELATASGGYGVGTPPSDNWRANIKPIAFTGPKKVIRVKYGWSMSTLHLYGHKATGETPDDLIWLDSDETGAEFATDEDFGDRPLGTTVVRTVKLKNVSPSLTANAIVVSCADADFILSYDGGTTWVSNFTIASLAPGVSSGDIQIRDTTPAPGTSALGPRFAVVSAVPGSWS